MSDSYEIFKLNQYLSDGTQVCIVYPKIDVFTSCQSMTSEIIQVEWSYFNVLISHEFNSF